MHTTLWVILSLVTGYIIHALKARVDNKRDQYTETETRELQDSNHDKLHEIINSQKEFIDKLMDQNSNRIDEKLDLLDEHSQLQLDYIELIKKYERIQAIYN